MSYANRKFGHCHVSWTIKGCCKWFFLLRPQIESPFFLMSGDVLTKWKIVLMSSPDKKSVSFRLRRLTHIDERNVWAHFRFSYYHNSKDYLIADGRRLFRPDEERDTGYEQLAANNDFMDVRLKLVVYQADNAESIAECEDLHLRQLSEDMKELYHKEPFPVNRVTFATTYSAIDVVKSILHQRIKNKKSRDAVSSGWIRMSDKYTYQDVEDVIRFLYSADIAPVVRLPNVRTYDLAEELEIRPLIAYYQPEKVNFHSSNLLQEFKITWSVAGLTSRKEFCLISPKIKGEIYHCILKIFTDVNKSSEGNIGVNFEIYLAVKRRVCIELSLKTESNTKQLMEDYHKTFEGQEIFGSANTIKPENLQIIPTDGCATIELNVCLSESPEDSTLGKSLTVCQPYCDQQNYIDLSKDMLFLYEEMRFKGDKSFNLMMHMYRFFLENRNSDFVTNFLDKYQINNLFNRIRFETLDQVVQFLFCGRFSEELYYKDVFYFYEVAATCEFASLKHALVDELKKQLSGQNVKVVFDFAKKFNISDLVAYINERFDVGKVW